MQLQKCELYNLLTYLETPKPVMKLRLLSHGTFMKLSLAFTCDIYRHIRHEWVSLDLLLVSKVIFFDNTKEKKLELGELAFWVGEKPSFIYIWSISHKLEHEFFCLGCLGSSGQ